MSDTNPFADYTARLREFIALACPGSGARPSSGAAMPELQTAWGNSSAPLRSCVAATAHGRASFEELALSLFELQFAYNLPYRRFCQARRVSPQNVEHWSRIPAVPTSAFKELDLSSLPAEQRTAVFHSSGTTEQRPSRHFHNADSLAVYEASLLPWFRRHVFPENRGGMPVLSLTPPPASVPHSSLVHMFETIRCALGSPESAFLGETDPDGSWSLNPEPTLQTLQQAAGNCQPILLFGTAFSFVHLLDLLEARDMKLELPSGSLAMETGGYKGRSRALPKAELHSLITARLAIPATHIICEYGMSELSSQAYDHALHAPRSTPHAPRFRFPAWARVQIISPETGRVVADGETGLIRIFDLANVYSVMALQTEDLGVRRGDGFELVGRAALAEARGCSLMAR